MFLVCICCFVLCYLPKLKRGMPLAFSANFLYMFSIKMFLSKYHISWPSSSIRPNFLTKISNKVYFQILLNSSFKFFFKFKLMRDKLYNLVSSSSPALVQKSKKRGGNNAENLLISMFDFQFIHIYIYIYI